MQGLKSKTDGIIEIAIIIITVMTDDYKIVKMISTCFVSIIMTHDRHHCQKSGALVKNIYVVVYYVFIFSFWVEC